MLRNKNVLLTLVTILALASFGFTSFNAVSYGGSNNVAGQNLSVATSSSILTSANDGSPDECDFYEGRSTNCGLQNTTPFIAANAALAKVGPQLAGVCALFKQPAGTTVASVSDLFPGSFPPYFKVSLSDGATVYINAVTCNPMPAP
jgi:hypothetical protein